MNYAAEDEFYGDASLKRADGAQEVASFRRSRKTGETEAKVLQRDGSAAVMFDGVKATASGKDINIAVKGKTVAGGQRRQG